MTRGFLYMSLFYFFITVLVGWTTIEWAVAIFCPLFMWGSGAGMRGSLYAEFGAKIIGSIIGLSCAALCGYLLFNSNYLIIFFDTLIIQGYAWGVIGFILGFIASNKTFLSPQYHSENVGKDD
jgi:hypothetical protein